MDPEHIFEELIIEGRVLRVERSDEIRQSGPTQCWVELTVIGRFLISAMSVEFKQDPFEQT